jgi:hypothetical protein
MDFQTSDGRGMVLKYVSSYVSKTHDTVNTDGLYSYHVDPHQAAYRFISVMRPSEPEMWLSMTSYKQAWSSSRTKKFVVPRCMGDAEDNKICDAYRKRPEEAEDLTLLKWLRLYDTSKPNPVPYKSGTTLVGTKLLSVFNAEFHFFQRLLLSVAHRNLIDLTLREHESLPRKYSFFAASLYRVPKPWNNSTLVADYFSRLGNKMCYVQTVVQFIECMKESTFTSSSSCFFKVP